MRTASFHMVSVRDYWGPTRGEVGYGLTLDHWEDEWWRAAFEKGALEVQV